MIVSCPSCQTRYHWHAETGGRAVCDRCEAQVPLVASRPTYVVRAQAVAVTVGGGGSPLALQMEAPAPSFSGPPSGSEVPDFPSPTSEGPADAEPDRMFTSEAEPLEPASPRSTPRWDAELAADSDAGTPAPHSRRTSARGGSGRRLLQLFVAVLLAGAGVAAGHYAMMKSLVVPLQVHPAVEPLDPRLLGGLLGMVLAWPLIRWMSPRR